MTFPGQPNPALWTPARYIAFAQRCWFCGAFIPRDKPGRRVGDRGSKAFYNPVLQLWECPDCRAEATRAELAGLEPRAPRTEVCESCGYARLDTDSPASAPIFGLLPCAGCERGAGRGLHRTCPRCRHLEHRPHTSATPPIEGAA